MGHYEITLLGLNTENVRKAPRELGGSATGPPVLSGHLSGTDSESELVSFRPYAVCPSSGSP